MTQRKKGGLPAALSTNEYHWPVLERRQLVHARMAELLLQHSAANDAQQLISAGRLAYCVSQGNLGATEQARLHAVGRRRRAHCYCRAPRKATLDTQALLTRAKLIHKYRSAAPGLMRNVIGQILLQVHNA